jgi:hypothetical protein
VRNALAEARKPGAKRVVLRYATEPGLRLVAGPRGGVSSFSTTVREGGSRRESFTAIGRIEDLSLAAARIEVKKLKDDLRAGRDPNAERALAKPAPPRLAPRPSAGTRRAASSTPAMIARPCASPSRR